MNLAKARFNIAAAAVAASICCIHFGAAEFLSVQFLCFAISAVAAYSVVLRPMPRLVGVAAALLSVVLLSWYFAGHDEHLVLKGVRTTVVLVVLIAWQRRSLSLEQGSISLIQKGIFYACAFSLALGLAQLLDSFTVNSGLFDVPKAYFALDYGTSFADRRAVLAPAGYLIRPSALYSEPSALAALGVLSVATSYFSRNLPLRLMGFAVVVISQSLSGLVFAVLVSVLSATDRRERNVAVLLFLPVLIGGFLYLGSFFGGRVEAVLSGADLSARIRIFEPLSAIAIMAKQQMFFGADTGVLLRMASSDVGTIFDNWILNQFLLYGLLGSIWVATPFLFSRKAIWPLILAFMATNGDVFYYDRYYFLVLATIAASNIRSASK